MQDYRINTNYAKAIFLLAGETSEQEAVAADMRLIEEVCRENRVLNAVFANPTLKPFKKAAIVKELFGPKVCRLSQLFLDFVVRKQRSINLRGISLAYLDLYRQSRNIVLSELTTAVEADEEILASVRQLIADYTQKEVELKNKVDANGLGGFAIKFDNNMYDARLSTQLSKLRLEFDKNIYESKL